MLLLLLLLPRIDKQLLVIYEELDESRRQEMSFRIKPLASFAPLTEQFFEGIEDRLSKVEAHQSIGREAQTAEMQAAVVPYIDRLVRERLDAFEGEVQARLLIATAGAVRRRVTGEREAGGDDAAAGGGEASPNVASHGEVSNLRLEVKQLTESLTSLKTERAASDRCAVTRSELLAVVDHLRVVADVHASMQLAVSQLRTVCPELSRIVSLIKVGSILFNSKP